VLVKFKVQTEAAQKDKPTDKLEKKRDHPGAVYSMNFPRQGSAAFLSTAMHQRSAHTRGGREFSQAVFHGMGRERSIFRSLSRIPVSYHLVFLVHYKMLADAAMLVTMGAFRAEAVRRISDFTAPACQIKTGWPQKNRRGQVSGRAAARGKI
jgi:hypothetical protein